jgi:hypothetical protein
MPRSRRPLLPPRLLRQQVVSGPRVRPHRALALVPAPAQEPLRPEPAGPWCPRAESPSRLPLECAGLRYRRRASPSRLLPAGVRPPARQPVQGVRPGLVPGVRLPGVVGPDPVGRVRALRRDRPPTVPVAAGVVRAVGSPAGQLAGPAREHPAAGLAGAGASATGVDARPGVDRLAAAVATSRSSKLRRSPTTPRRTRPFLKGRSSSKGARRPRSWAPSSTGRVRTWSASCSSRARW